MNSRRLILSIGLCFFYYVLASQDLLPIKGRWHPNNQSEYDKDYVGVWKNSHRTGYLDATGNGNLTGVTADLGSYFDVPLTMDYTGDDRDEIVLYRPTSRELIFYSDFSFNTSHHYTRDVGDVGDILLTGDWDGNGKDGFALFREDDRQIWYYENFDSANPFPPIQLDNSNSIPIIGNWDGEGGDGYAMYDPDTREISFYQSFEDTQPFYTRDYGNPGDKIIAGDWDGNGTDVIALFRQSSTNTFQFIYFNLLEGPPVSTVSWTDKAVYVSDISQGRKVFYTNNVPHSDFQGNTVNNYNPETSFFPKGIYNAPPSAFSELDGSGFNLALLNTVYYPMSQENKDDLDFTSNRLRVVSSWLKIGGYPFIGKFTGEEDLVGIGSKSDARILYYDSDGNGEPDTQKDVGDGHDIPFTGDWDADAMDELALFRKSSNQIIFFNNISSESTHAIKTLTLTSEAANGHPVSGDWDGLGSDDEFMIYKPETREILFYNNIDDPSPYMTRQFTTPVDKVIAGDWNGDGIDGFGIYDAFTREILFYETKNSPSPFLVRDVGNHGDIPISGDWDGDGSDGFGLFRTDPQYTVNTFITYDNLFNLSIEAGTISFGNPLVEGTPKKYVYGLYTFDEPQSREEIYWPDIYNDLSALYDTYDALNNPPYIFFHADGPYISAESNPNYNTYWKNFAHLAEVAVHDDYPIKTVGDSLPPPPPDISTITSVANTVEHTRLETNESKPNWFIAQAFQDLDGGPPNYFRFYKPNPAQYRAMIYTAILHGATGIFTFGYHNPNISSTTTGISKTAGYSDLWDEAEKINHEIDDLKQYILTPTALQNYKLYVAESPAYEENSPIRSLLKFVNGYYVLLTVNITKQPLNAIIQLPHSISPGDGQVMRMFEGTSTQIMTGAINDFFPAFGVHIYKFAAPLGSGGGGNANVSENLLEQKNSEALIYPNPSHGSVTFEIRNLGNEVFFVDIFDALGRPFKTLTSESSKGTNKLVWDASEYSNGQARKGLYFYRLRTEQNVIESGKLLIN